MGPGNKCRDDVLGCVNVIRSLLERGHGLGSRLIIPLEANTQFAVAIGADFAAGF